LRETLEGLLKRTRNPEKRAKHEAALECPPFPMALDYLWRIFNRLNARRGSNGFGPNAITWADIDAFIKHSKIDLAPWEIEVIEMLDDLYRADPTKKKETE
jgi:hypothetical protein